MSADSTENQTIAPCANPDGDSVLKPITTLPEADALKYYADLPSKLQWLARQAATGQRRAALILYHALEIARFK
jgi:hypothetical protein